MSDNIPGVVVIDDFFPDFNRVRQHAILSEFYDWLGPDNEVYKRITMLHVPQLFDCLTSTLGGVKIVLSGYRLNYEHEPPNQSIHSDLGYGSHVIVIYLNEGDSGTAFWKHKETGTTEINYGDLELFTKIKNDFEDADAWEQIDLVPAKANRAVIYKNNLFHSRFPFKAFGSTPEDGRLIAIAFFHFLEDLND